MILHQKRNTNDKNRFLRKIFYLEIKKYSLLWAHTTDPWCKMLQILAIRSKHMWKEIVSRTHCEHKFKLHFQDSQTYFVTASNILIQLFTSFSTLQITQIKEKPSLSLKKKKKKKRKKENWKLTVETSLFGLNDFNVKDNALINESTIEYIKTDNYHNIIITTLFLFVGLDWLSR